MIRRGDAVSGIAPGIGAGKTKIQGVQKKILVVGTTLCG